MLAHKVVNAKMKRHGQLVHFQAFAVAERLSLKSLQLSAHIGSYAMSFPSKFHEPWNTFFGGTPNNRRSPAKPSKYSSTYMLDLPSAQYLRMNAQASAICRRSDSSFSAKSTASKTRVIGRHDRPAASNRAHL